jgi:uncharacterized membrane protein
MTLQYRVLLGLLIVLSVAVGIYAFLFQLGLAGGTDFQTRFAATPLFASWHILGSGVALLIGGFQFLPGLRARHLNIHRWLGRIYLLAVLLGGIGGVVMAQTADGGLVARIGFATLGVLWLFSGTQAYLAIRRGDIERHRLWMTRNFALTFAAVTLRIYLGIMTGPLQLSFAEAYPVMGWLCWVPNLIVADWWLLHRRGLPPAQTLAGRSR